MVIHEMQAHLTCGLDFRRIWDKALVWWLLVCTSVVPAGATSLDPQSVYAHVIHGHVYWGQG